MSTIKYKKFNFLTESLEDVYVTDQPELVMKTTNNGVEYEGFSSLINSGITSFPSRQWYVGGSQNNATGLLIRDYSYTSGDSGEHVSVWPANPSQYYKTVSQINGDTNKIKIKVNVAGLVDYLENKYGEDQIDYSDPATTIFRTESMYAWISGITIYQFNNAPAAYEWKEDETTHISSWVSSSRVINRTIQRVTISIKDLKSNTVIERNYIPQGISGDNIFQENVFVICTILLFTDFNPNYTAYEYYNSYVRYINNNGSVVQKDENDELIYSTDTGRLAYPLFNVYEGDEHLLYNNDRSNVYISQLSENFADRVLDNVYGVYGMSPQSAQTLNGGTITYIDKSGNTQSESTSGEGFQLHSMNTLPIAYNDSTYTMSIANAIVDYDEVEPEPGEEGKYVIQIKFKGDSSSTSSRPSSVQVAGWLELSDAHTIEVNNVYVINSSNISDEIDLGEGITVTDYNIEFDMIDGYTLESDVTDTAAVATYILIPKDPDDPEDEPEEYEGEPNIPELPEDPTEQPPTPPTPTPQDFLEAITGYLDGKEGESNLEEEEEKDSDIEEPYNGRTNLNVVAQSGSNWNLIIGNLDTIADLKDRLLQVLGSNYDKALLLVDQSYDVENVINRIIQLPFTVTYIRDQLINMYGSSIVSGCPCHNEIPLCSELGLIQGNSEMTAKEAYASLVANRLGNTAADLTFQNGTLSGIKAWFNLIKGVSVPTSGVLQVATHFSPITHTAITYPISRYRFVPIDYGEVEFKKIFGNALDYTEVNYTLELPTGIKIALDPQLLFRNPTNGSEANTTVLHVQGMLDLETGDILITVTANDDMIIQTTINVAMERSIYGKDQTQALRNIGTSIMDMVRISAGMLPSMNYVKSDVGSGTSSVTGSYNIGVTEAQSSRNGWQKSNSTGSHRIDTAGWHQAIKPGDNYTTAWYEPEDKFSEPTMSKGASMYEGGGSSNQNSTSMSSSAEQHSSNTVSNSKVMNRGLSAGPVIDIMKGATESLARSATGVPYVNLSSAQPGGAVRLLANQLPILHYDYPEIITPRINQSYYNPWEYPYKYEEEYGLNALTTKVGKGFNRYMSITNVSIGWYSWSHEELSGFTSSLLHGFYIYDEANIYPKNSIYGQMFGNKYVYDETTGRPTNNRVDLYSEQTGYITLLNIFSEYERYVDRLLLGSTATQGGNINYCYKCDIYKTENIDTPVIEVDQSIYTHQNTALWCGRVYHVVGVDYLPGHIVRLYLEEDYLTTWYYLAIVKGIIDRSTSYPINNLHNEFPKTVRRIYKKIIFDDLQSKLGVAVVAATPNPCATKEDLILKGYDIAKDWVENNAYT